MSEPCPGRKIVAHNVVHLRAEPSNDSERVSQTLMGRTVLVHEARAAWSYVETDDTYRGWAENRWLRDPPGVPLTPVKAVFADLRAAPRDDAPLLVRLPVLAAVQVEAPPAPGGGGAGGGGDWVAAMLPNGVAGWLPGATPDFSCPPGHPPAGRVIGGGGGQITGRAREFLGTPYLWGGSSSFGLDCSGFVQLCYRLAGVILRRDAGIQRSDPRFLPVDEGDLAPGDLVFFGKPDRITHVGMHLEGGAFIHSAGGAGVIVTAWGDDRYSPSFVDARRLDPARAHEPVTRP